jgi:hypothetical protein
MTRMEGRCVAELLAKSPGAGFGLPKSIGAARLEEWLPGPITALSPYAGQHAAVDAALQPLGLAFPGPNAMLASGAGRMVWTGRAQAFLIGVPCPDVPGAAITDQSDGWVGLRLSGPSARDVLARLVPLDLRDSAFGVGTAARSMLGHMPLVLMRPAPDVWEVLTFRSMARTALHELAEAMTALAGRAAL